jgi:hypothetical protein
MLATIEQSPIDGKWYIFTEDNNWFSGKQKPSFFSLALAEMYCKENNLKVENTKESQPFLNDAIQLNGLVNGWSE